MINVVLTSGGLNSAILLYHVLHDCVADSGSVYPLTIGYDQSNYAAERSSLYELTMINLRGLVRPPLVHKLDIISRVKKQFPQFRVEEPPTYAPNLNMMMISIAASVGEMLSRNKEPVLIWSGISREKETRYWDCSEEFINNINWSFSRNSERKVRVITPFIRFDKDQMVLRGESLGVSFESTWSCIKGDRTVGPCGKCESCIDRKEAFESAMEEDPLERTKK